MEIYNPFHKPIEELSTSDLVTLRDVSEGWHVEYKREINDKKSPAKSISAFANSYGGWLFYGVEESKDGHRTAAAFPGIAISDVPRIEQLIQAGVGTHVSPTPYFKITILRGPDAVLGLAPDHAVIVLHIPLGRHAPYIHGSGRIYRRVADASEPTHETDRHVLDLLWKRSHSYKKIFKKIISEPPQLSEAEAELSYIKLFFFPDPWGQRNIYTKLNFKEFSDLMAGNSIASHSLPFDNIFQMSTGYVARQTKNNDPTTQVFTWKYHYDAISEITIPVNMINFSSLQAVNEYLEGYQERDAFVQQCKLSGITSARLIDLSSLYVTLVAICARNLELLDAESIQLPLFFKAQLTNIWRRIPFLDTSDSTNFIKTHGIPFIQESKCFVPIGVTPDTCGKLEATEGEFLPHLHAAILLTFVTQALGIPSHVIGVSSNAESGAMGRIIDMEKRALEVMRSRIELRKLV